MAVAIREVRTGKDFKRFIYFPEKLYASRYPQWVHPIYTNERDFFNKKKNPSWEHCEGVCFLAERKEIVGRIMGIINHKGNKFLDSSFARFSHFDCIDDQEVASLLFREVEEWAKKQGCDQVIGPMALTDLDPEGMLVEGFEERASITTWWHPPYTPRLVENAGYRKHVDWVTYYVDFSSWPASYEKIARRLLERTDYVLREFTRTRELKPFILPVFELINRTYDELYSFSPFTDEEARKISADYLTIIEPRLVKIVTMGKEVIAFALGFPDMTEGIQAARGRLFPFGLFKILKSRQQSRRLDMMLGAIDKNHRGKGIDVLMANAMYSSARELGMDHADSHHEFETNTKVRAEMERVGGRIYKRHRLFIKDLV